MKAASGWVFCRVLGCARFTRPFTFPCIGPPVSSGVTWRLIQWNGKLIATYCRRQGHCNRGRHGNKGRLRARFRLRTIFRLLTRRGHGEHWRSLQRPLEPRRHPSLQMRSGRNCAGVHRCQLQRYTLCLFMLPARRSHCARYHPGHEVISQFMQAGLAAKVLCLGTGLDAGIP